MRNIQDIKREWEAGSLPNSDVDDLIAFAAFVIGVTTAPAPGEASSADFPASYRRVMPNPKEFPFEALAEDGELIEVRACRSSVALTPGSVYHNKTGNQDFFLFWADDLVVAAQRALNLVKAHRADQKADP